MFDLQEVGTCDVKGDKSCEEWFDCGDEFEEDVDDEPDDELLWVCSVIAAVWIVNPLVFLPLRMGVPFSIILYSINFNFSIRFTGLNLKD